MEKPSLNISNQTKYTENPVELTKKLVKIPSYYPFEHQIVEVISNFLKAQGFIIDLIPVENRFEIFATKGIHKTEPFDNRLLFFGHMDTVPIQGAEMFDPIDQINIKKVEDQATSLGWTHLPFSAIQVDGKIYGLGAVDMKAEIAALLSVASRLPNEWYLSHQLVIAFTVAEEYLSQGAWELIKSKKLKGIPAAICGEILDTDPENPSQSAGADTLVVGRRGRVAFEIEVFGTPAHAAMPHAGINAIEEASRFIIFLQNQIKRNEIPLSRHSILPQASMTPLSIQAGTSSLSIPARCTITYDRHLVPPETLVKAKLDLHNIISKCVPPLQFKIGESYRPVPYLPPYQTDLDADIVQIARKIMEKRYPNLTITGGNSVADENFLGTKNLPNEFKLAIPLVVLGAKGGNFHQINEWVDIASIYELENNIYDICIEWWGAKSNDSIKL